MSNLSHNQPSPFESIRHTDDQGDEFWTGREMMPLLGYTSWQNFNTVVIKAQKACKNTGNEVTNHFTDANKMVEIGYGVVREVPDYKLTRYGCYLVAMNGDPRKPEIAAAQSYFAVKTHQAESAEKDSQLPQVSVKDEIDILSQCLSIAEIDPRLIAGVTLNHAGKRLPQLKEAIAESHKLLAAAGQNELLLSPTTIGERIGVSGQKVNKTLLNLGFQVKNTNKKSKTEPDYFATESGKQYAGNTMATGELRDKGADNTTYQHLKWKESVIDIVRQNLAS